MITGEFRCCFYTGNYEATLAFYRDGLGLSVLRDWDRGPDDRGVLFSAASGIIEVLARPRERKPSVWGGEAPQGIQFAIEIDDVEALYRRAVEKELPIKEELKNQSWGHRSFRLGDPNGITLYLFSKA